MEGDRTRRLAGKIERRRSHRAAERRRLSAVDRQRVDPARAGSGDPTGGARGKGEAAAVSCDGPQGNRRTWRTATTVGRINRRRGRKRYGPEVDRLSGSSNRSAHGGGAGIRSVTRGRKAAGKSENITQTVTQGDGACIQEIDIIGDARRWARKRDAVVGVGRVEARGIYVSLKRCAAPSLTRQIDARNGHVTTSGNSTAAIDRKFAGGNIPRRHDCSAGRKRKIVGSACDAAQGDGAVVRL